MRFMNGRQLLLTTAGVAVLSGLAVSGSALARDVSARTVDTVCMRKIDSAKTRRPGVLIWKGGCWVIKELGRLQAWELATKPAPEKREPDTGSSKLR
jgi:hypothetical protein